MLGDIKIRGVQFKKDPSSPYYTTSFAGLVLWLRRDDNGTFAYGCSPYDTDDYTPIQDGIGSDDVNLTVSLWIRKVIKGFGGIPNTTMPEALELGRQMLPQLKKEMPEFASLHVYREVSGCHHVLCVYYQGGPYSKRTEVQFPDEGPSFYYNLNNPFSYLRAYMKVASID